MQWTPSNHTALDSTDTNLYAYISGEKHVIKIGSDEAVWHFDTATQTFLKTDCVDNVKDHFCDYCGDKLIDHTGGQATCTEKAVCTYCGRPYGDEPSHSYAPCAAKAATCTAKGLFLGDEHGNLNPTARITRAEFATVLMRYLGGSYQCPIGH